MDLLCKASRHYQQTVLMITHNMNLTSQADRVFQVTDGELIELGGCVGLKHYLDLIQISAKQHKKQNRMTRLCIVLAVFLVTVIFGMADMEMRAQRIQARKTDGSWHAAFQVEAEQGALLSARPEIRRAARYGTLNYHLKDGYLLQGTETGVCGFDLEFQEMIPDARVSEGTFPETDREAVVNENIRARLGTGVGDTVELTTPGGDTKQ